MRHHLVIVESGSKTRTIQKILGSEYTVIASGGHIDNLPKKELGVDVTDEFRTHYSVLPAKRQWIRDVRERLQKNQEAKIWLATDKDLEGERIAEAIRIQCRLKQGTFQRVYFTEITPVAIREAFSHPLPHLDAAALESQETRRVLDRLIGYQLSPLLWKRFPQNSRTPLSIGRVQAATLSLVVERSQQHELHENQKKWSIHGQFQDLPRASLTLLDDLDNNKTKIHRFLQSLQGVFTATAMSPTLVKTYPPPPFMTSTIQQTAYRELGIPIQRTMKICQELYEKGKITYPRTDSCILSETFQKEALAFLQDRYGVQSISTATTGTKKSRAGSQEAHESIRPTSCCLETLPETEAQRDHARLYALIWRRTMASLMRPAEYKETKIHIRDASFPLDSLQVFRCAPRSLVFPGFMLLSPSTVVVEKKQYPETPWIVACTGSVEAREIYDAPPARYDEASLVRRMEEEGIGRPATYQQSIDKLVDKHYIEKRGTEGRLEKISVLRWTSASSKILEHVEEVRVGAEPSSRFASTELGLRVHGFLQEHFPDIVSVSFTKEMETKLDEVQKGLNSRLAILGTFYDTWEPLIQSVGSLISNTSGSSAVVPKAIPLREFKIGRRLYRVYQGQYGPYLKFKEGTHIKNVGLTPYLQWKGLDSIDDLSSEDITLLTSMPVTVREGGVGYKMEYGRYGFYCRADKTLTPVQIRSMLLRQFPSA
jgi:DNA topoisomerase-1